MTDSPPLSLRPMLVFSWIFIHTLELAIIVAMLPVMLLCLLYRQLCREREHLYKIRDEYLQ